LLQILLAQYRSSSQAKFERFSATETSSNLVLNTVG